MQTVKSLQAALFIVGLWGSFSSQALAISEISVTKVTINGKAIINVKGNVLRAKGNRAEVQVRFNGVADTGEALQGQGVLRIQDAIITGLSDQSSTSNFELSDTLLGLMIFTGSVTLHDGSVKYIDADSRVKLDGIIKQVIDSTGQTIYRLNADGVMRFVGDVAVGQDF